MAGLYDEEEPPRWFSHGRCSNELLDEGEGSAERNLEEETPPGSQRPCSGLPTIWDQNGDMAKSIFLRRPVELGAQIWRAFTLSVHYCSQKKFLGEKI